jgi:hypothetical protein
MNRLGKEISTETKRRVEYSIGEVSDGDMARMEDALRDAYDNY